MNIVILNATFPGEPVALQRHQMRGARGKKFYVGRGGVQIKQGRQGFTPEKSRRAKETLQWQLKALGKQYKPVGGPIGVQLVFYLKNVAKDGDNLEKLVLDAFTGHLWIDDAQIIECSWRKRPLADREKFGSTRIVVYRILPDPSGE
jgi:Holliday junction resolvase RusA-like endonuclease